MNKHIKLALLFCSLTFCFSSYSQDGKFKTFKLVVISTDTAIIDPSLKYQIDTIEQKHLQGYYYQIERTEESIKFRDYPTDSLRRKMFIEYQELRKVELDSLKKLESQAKQFKYYESISEMTVSVFQYYFSEYKPRPNFQLIPKSNLSFQHLSDIADSLKADYVVGFKNIHTVNKNGEISIKLTTLLYSKKDNKILAEKETSGDMSSQGDMWSCMGALECLFTTTVKSSTDWVAEILYKRHLN